MELEEGEPAAGKVAVAAGDAGGTAAVAVVAAAGDDGGGDACVG